MSEETCYAPIEIESKEQMEMLNITWKDVTYYKIGLKFVPVYLVPTNEATREYLLKELNNKYANPTRKTRCIIPGRKQNYVRCRLTRACDCCPYELERMPYDPGLCSLEDLQGEGMEPADDSFPPELVVELRDLLERIREMNPVFHKVIVMKAAGYPEREISAALGITPAAVQRALGKAQEYARRYRDGE